MAHAGLHAVLCAGQLTWAAAATHAGQVVGARAAWCSAPRRSSAEVEQQLHHSHHQHSQQQGGGGGGSGVGCAAGCVLALPVGAALQDGGGLAVGAQPARRACASRNRRGACTLGTPHAQRAWEPLACGRWPQTEAAPSSTAPQIPTPRAATMASRHAKPWASKARRGAAHWTKGQMVAGSAVQGALTGQASAPLTTGFSV